MSKSIRIMPRHHIAQQLDAEGVAIVKGVANLVALRRLLEHLVATEGFEISFHPESAPELRDYLVVPAIRGLERAAMGAIVGALFGVLFGDARTLVTLGAVAGGLYGVAEGAGAVRKGWRLRATWDENLEPVVEITGSAP